MMWRYVVDCCLLRLKILLVSIFFLVIRFGMLCNVIFFLVDYWRVFEYFYWWLYIIMLINFNLIGIELYVFNIVIV